MLEGKNLKNNDLIWGKTENGDWWPGQITVDPQRPKKKLYQVDFFGYPLPRCQRARRSEPFSVMKIEPHRFIL